MPDGSALMGLIGAASGAVVGATAAVYGPLVLKKKERQWQELAREDELYTTQVTALTLGRLKTRRWFDYLNLTVAMAVAGEQVDIKEFVETCHDHRSESFDSIYAPVLQHVGGRSMHYSVTALQRASDTIAVIAGSRGFDGGQVPTSVTEALEAADIARTWFRTTIERLVATREAMTAQEFARRYPGGRAR